MTLPLLIEADELATLIGNNHPHIKIFSLTSLESYRAGHIPGALLLPPTELQCGTPPAVGKLPPAKYLSELFSQLGLRRQDHIVAYDDEGGGWAGRLVWTMDVLNQPCSMLNGGIYAWKASGHATETRINEPVMSYYAVQINRSPIIDCHEVIQSLSDKKQVIWDARSREEYDGKQLNARRAGHIPGAVHCDWKYLMDKKNHYRLRHKDTLIKQLKELGCDKDKNIITYCHTHHRSGLSYFVGKWLGYRIRAYDGGWAEWGSLDDTPIEV